MIIMQMPLKMEWLKMGMFSRYFLFKLERCNNIPNYIAQMGHIFIPFLHQFENLLKQLQMQLQDDTTRRMKIYLTLQPCIEHKSLLFILLRS